MVKCANCQEKLCSENDILDMIEAEEYDEIVDGGYCFEITCEKCSHDNQVFVKTKMQIASIDVD